jgi:sigma-B regulation protein RsbU (phosphoserine phosphatase)
MTAEPDRELQRRTMAASILIVDDETDLELLILQRFRRQVREGLYQFHFARNGAEALAALEAEPAVEVVMTDINMPVMDGLTLLARLRERPGPLGTVVVSAYGDMPNIRAAMNQGASDFLTKPIDFHDFEVTLDKTLQQVRRLRQAAADRDRLVALDHDLQTAAIIQRSFLPPGPEVYAGRSDFAVAAVTHPARQVGGDFYDHFLVDDDRLGLVIGDVSGKGLPASLFMAVTRTLIRAFALGGAAPGDCLREVNRHLLRDTSSGLFVTLIYGVLHLPSGSFNYASGGHPAPYRLAVGGPEPLDGRGLVVGVLDEANYETHHTTLRPGDRLFLYSDGIPEAANIADEQFSDERLRAVLAGSPENAPDQLIEHVLAAVRQFTAGAPQSDDITALALGYAGPAGTRPGGPS